MEWGELFKSYYFWFVLISLLCLLLERIWPWRQQPLLRNQWSQDIIWSIFNIFLFSLIFKEFLIKTDSNFNDLMNTFHLNSMKEMFKFHDNHLLIQIIIGLLIKDFIEWLIHNLLHRVPYLWRIHQLHHSIKIMDWIGNTRFHFLEIIVYKFLKYLPLIFLQFSFEALLIIDIFSTLIGHLNHSNLKITWGPLKYIFNSPAMHIWHHDKTNHYPKGQNFGIVFSIWDWIFQTAYMPSGQPNELGFAKEDKYPSDMLRRLLWPFYK